MAAADAQATVCKKFTPDYSDIVSDRMYVKSKCKTLVSNFDRNRLSSEAKALHQALAAATSDYMTMAIAIGNIR